MDNTAHIKREYRTDNFIRFLLDGKREITNEEVEIRKNCLGLSLIKAPFAVAMIAPDFSPVKYGTKDAFLVEYEKYIEKWLSKTGYVSYSLINSYNNIVVLFSFGCKDVKNQELNEIFINLHKALLHRFGLEVFIGIGDIVSSYKDISYSASNAHEMLSFKFQYADSGVVNIATIVQFQYNISRGNGIEFDRVIGCFKDGNLGKMEVRLNELIESVRHRPNVSSTSIRRTLVEVTVHLLHTASNANVDVDSVLGDTDPYRWIMRQNHTEIITQWIMKLSSQLLDTMKNKRQTGEKDVIRQAKVYIEENLSKTELTLSQISSQIGLSNTYFSQLFKNEVGVGINTYITEKRIYRAKTLLSDTKLSAADISKQTGFMSPAYFGQVFKKSTGVTPLIYRREALKK